MHTACFQLRCWCPPHAQGALDSVRTEKDHINGYAGGAVAGAIIGSRFFPPAPYKTIRTVACAGFGGLSGLQRNPYQVCNNLVYAAFTLLSIVSSLHQHFPVDNNFIRELCTQFWLTGRCLKLLFVIPL